MRPKSSGSLRRLRTAIAVGVTFAVAPTAKNWAAEAANPPNIVVIMTDDQWYNSMAYMPKTNELLAAQGVRFTNFQVSNPLCAPSRSTFLTGLYSHNHGIASNPVTAGGAFAKFDDTNTLATWLHDAGYHTSLIGKYINGYGDQHVMETYVPPGWDNWIVATSNTMVLAYDYVLNENGTLVSYGSSPSDYKTDVLADKAVANIDARAGMGPFFMAVMPTAPHSEFKEDPQSIRAALRHEGLFASEAFPIPANFNERDVSDKPQFIRSRPRLTTAAQAAIAQSWRDKLEALQSVDDLVERIVRELATLNVLDETIIIFTSDNGCLFGEHRIGGGKWRVYDEATRVPLIIRGAEFVGGVTRSQVVANVDLAPTIAALAGVTPGLNVDGISLVPYATSDRYRQSRAVLLEIEPTTLDTYRALRTRLWTYSQLGTGEEELYNQVIDPYQLTSRHADMTLFREKSALATVLETFRNCSGTSCDLDWIWLRLRSGTVVN
jgi:N-acetylglucosamine-6-sulfatase